MKLTQTFKNENNKLIADFDGKECLFLKGRLLIRDDSKHSYYGSLYDEDWVILMSVIQKIECLYYKGFPIIVNISRNGAFIGINGTNACGEKLEGKKVIANTLNINYFALSDVGKVTKIKAVWLAVVQFIKWFNQNK
jgi:hypothetical protein